MALFNNLEFNKLSINDNTINLDHNSLKYIITFLPIKDCIQLAKTCKIIRSYIIKRDDGFSSWIGKIIYLMDKVLYGNTFYSIYNFLEKIYNIKTTNILYYTKKSTTNIYALPFNKFQLNIATILLNFKRTRFEYLIDYLIKIEQWNKNEYIEIINFLVITVIDIFYSSNKIELKNNMQHFNIYHFLDNIIYFTNLTFKYHNIKKITLYFHTKNIDDNNLNYISNLLFSLDNNLIDILIKNFNINIEEYFNTDYLLVISKKYNLISYLCNKDSDGDIFESIILNGNLKMFKGLNYFCPKNITFFCDKLFNWYYNEEININILKKVLQIINIKDNNFYYLIDFRNIIFMENHKLIISLLQKIKLPKYFKPKRLTTKYENLNENIVYYLNNNNLISNSFLQNVVIESTKINYNKYYHLNKLFSNLNLGKRNNNYDSYDFIKKKKSNNF